MWRNASWMKRCGCGASCRANPRRARATEPIMPQPFPESIQRKIEDRLRFYDDLGIHLFYRDRANPPVLVDSVAPSPVVAMEEVVVEEMELPKSAPKPVESKPVAAKFA